MTNSTVGEKIRIMRDEFKMPKSKLAAKSGVSENSIYRWEKGMNIPGKYQLYKIAEVFDVPPNWFLLDVEEPFTPNTSTVGERIMFVRESNKISQSEFANKIGVTKNTVYRWEKGHNPPFESNLKKIAETFGVPIDWFLQDMEIEAFETVTKVEIGCATNDDSILPKKFSVIGERIKLVRECKKMSQLEFADKIGVYKNTIHNWEKGLCTPSKHQLNIISKTFDVPLAWLLLDIEHKQVNLKTSTIDKHPHFETAEEVVELEESSIPESKSKEVIVAKKKEAETSVVTLKKRIDSETKYILDLFTTLSATRQGRLLGYLDALCREEAIRKRD